MKLSKKSRKGLWSKKYWIEKRIVFVNQITKGLLLKNSVTVYLEPLTNAPLSVVGESGSGTNASYCITKKMFVKDIKGRIFEIKTGMNTGGVYSSYKAGQDRTEIVSQKQTVAVLIQTINRNGDVTSEYLYHYAISEEPKNGYTAIGGAGRSDVYIKCGWLRDTE